MGRLTNNLTDKRQNKAWVQFQAYLNNKQPLNTIFQKLENPLVKLADISDTEIQQAQDEVATVLSNVLQKASRSTDPLAAGLKNIQTAVSQVAADKAAEAAPAPAASSSSTSSPAATAPSAPTPPKKKKSQEEKFQIAVAHLEAAKRMANLLGTTMTPVGELSGDKVLDTAKMQQVINDLMTQQGQVMHAPSTGAISKLGKLLGSELGMVDIKYNERTGAFSVSFGHRDKHVRAVNALQDRLLIEGNTYMSWKGGSKKQQYGAAKYGLRIGLPTFVEPAKDTELQQFNLLSSWMKEEMGKLRDDSPEMPHKEMTQIAQAAVYKRCCEYTDSTGANPRVQHQLMSRYADAFGLKDLSTRGVPTYKQGHTQASIRLALGDPEGASKKIRTVKPRQLRKLAYKMPSFHESTNKRFSKIIDIMKQAKSDLTIDPSNPDQYLSEWHKLTRTRCAEASPQLAALYDQEVLPRYDASQVMQKIDPVLQGQKIRFGKMLAEHDFSHLNNAGQEKALKSVETFTKKVTAERKSPAGSGKNPKTWVKNKWRQHKTDTVERDYSYLQNKLQNTNHGMEPFAPQTDVSGKSQTLSATDPKSPTP